MAHPIKITMQRRENQKGEVAFRAIILIKDRVFDGWGKTPREAQENLRAKVALAGIYLQEKMK